MMPMLCCFLSVICMMGVLGAFDWDVTVISSNFVSLQLIITLAIVVHLVVRYREFQLTLPQADHRTLIKETIRTKFVPCLYAALTTIAGFRLPVAMRHQARHSFRMDDEHWYSGIIGPDVFIVSLRPHATQTAESANEAKIFQVFPNRFFSSVHRIPWEDRF
jgi:hypothetical protein